MSPRHALSPVERRTGHAVRCVAAALLLLASSPMAWAGDVPSPLPAEKLERLFRERGGLDPGMPGPVLPVLPMPHALGCATPQTAGIIQATHPYYDVFLDAAGGAFTARTGASHSVTALGLGPQNVIYGGQTGGPGTSDISWRFHVQARTYLNPGGGSACVFDPPDTAMEPASIGIEQEFVVSPEPGVTATLRQEIVAFGTDESNSGIRLTLATTNHASSTQMVVVGVRWQIDYQNAGDDGPWFATVTCDPPVVDREWSLEHELAPAEIRDFYRIQNNESWPIFSNVSSTTAISGIPDTSTPDRLIYGRWGAMRASAWDYVTSEGACCPDIDSAVLYYHGYLPADADVIMPGETRRHSVVIFSSAESVDCGAFIPSCASSVSTPPASQRICAGGSATLDASGISLTDCEGSVEYTWTDGTSSWGGSTILVSPADTTGYSVAVTCSTDPACRVDDAVTVTVDRPPVLEPPLAADPDPCTSGIKLTWDPAVFTGAAGAGVYNVYRSESSCADALLQRPVAQGLSAPGWFDVASIPGRTYYYVVEAEDLSPGTTCSPTGPSGGSVTRLCASAIDDVVDDALPEGAGPVLRATHRGDEIRLSWTALRPLLPGEHPHLLKAHLDPRGPFFRVGADGDLSPGHAETDTSSWLQFFDLRVANSCERESLKEYGPSQQ